MKSNRFSFAVSALALCALASSALAAAPAATVGDKPLSYDDLTTTMGEVGPGNVNINKALVGKTVTLKLSSDDGGTTWFVKADEVLFVCSTSKADYKGGPVTAKIMKIEEDDEDENYSIVTLDRCGA